MYEWTEEYSVNVSVIDEQHKKLFKMINTYYEKTKQGASRHALQELLNKLKDYTDYHFKEEEKYFRAFNYDDADLHIQTHRKLTQKVNTYIDSYNSGDNFDTNEFCSFLNNWLKVHIKGTDKQFTDCFNQNGLL